MSRVGTHFISIASGKGGVGKTSVSVNLAWALAEAGQRVCLLDADLGLSNVDVLLGVSCEATLEQVIFEGLPMERAATRVAPNLQVISGSSGVSRMAELSRAKRRRLIEEFKKLEAYDYVLIDNSPGITAQVVSVCLSSRDVVLVVNPDAGSITDAYALIKVMRENGLWWPPLLLMNRTRSAETARRIFERVKQTAQKHLNLDCGYLGWLPEDPSVTRAAIVQRPAAEAFPDSPFTRAVLRTAGVIRRYSATAKGRVVAGDQFWENSVMRLKSG
ncbi:MAG: MinD/ParA family protein, partial [Desulfovibrionaceae bacterium]|nr:MinD/ParA family protein [Desulfovibrionaceae bacterium]